MRAVDKYDAFIFGAPTWHTDADSERSQKVKSLSNSNSVESLDGSGLDKSNDDIDSDSSIINEQILKRQKLRERRRERLRQSKKTGNLK